MGYPMNLIRASADDAPELSRIAYESKSSWVYPASWLKQWQEALTVTPEYIRSSRTFIMEVEHDKAGFYGLSIDRESGTLDHLWVLPHLIGCGLGRVMFGHAEKQAKLAGATRLLIESDPHADGFYETMGAVPVSKRPAPMDGTERMLTTFLKAIR
jgi:GNAT superfamily N-acetyltransferase